LLDFVLNKPYLKESLLFRDPFFQNNVHSMHIRWSALGNLTSAAGGRLRASSSAAAAAAEEALHGKYGADDVLYVVMFGILANVIIAAACCTTLAFVRSRHASSKGGPKAGQEDAVVQKKRTLQDACATVLVAPDVYRVLAPAATTTTMPLAVRI
jgi:hypothetical protein